MYTDAEKRLAVFIEQNVEDEDIAAYLEEVCHLLENLNHCLFKSILLCSSLPQSGSP
jgi:hypothetical protein